MQPRRAFTFIGTSLLTLPAASTKGDQFIRAAEIDLLDDHDLAKDGRTKWMGHPYGVGLAKNFAFSKSRDSTERIQIGDVRLYTR